MQAEATQPGFPTPVWAAIALAATLAAAFLGLRLQAYSVAVMWPAAGVVAGLILASRGRYRVIAALAALAALAVGNLSQGRSPLASAIFMAGNLAQAYLIAIVLERLAGRPFRLTSLPAVALFAAVAAIAPAVIGAPVAAGLIAAGHSVAPFADVWWVWLTSQALGVLTFMPATLLLGSRQWLSNAAIEDAALAAAVTTVAAVTIIGVAPDPATALVLGAIMLVPVLWWVWRRASAERVALAVLAVAVVTIWETTAGQGVFGSHLPAAQLFIVASSAALLALGAWREERPMPAPPVGLNVPRAIIVLSPLMVFAALAWWSRSFHPEADRSAWLSEVIPFAILAVLAALALHALTRHALRIAAEAETARAEVEAGRRQSYLLDLGDALRDLDDPATIMAMGSKRLGRRLGAREVAYAEVDEAGGVIGEPGGWTAGGAPAGRAGLDLAGLGREDRDALRAGREVRVRDLSDRREAGPGQAGGALLVVPLRRNDRLAAVMMVGDAAPRDWSDEDVRLARETAERTWAVIERRRAERGLRQSEERLRLASEAAGFGVYDFDVARQAGTWSRGMHVIFGTDGRADISMEYVRSLTHPEERDRVFAAMAAALRRIGQYEIESRIVRSDGQVRWILDRGQSDGPLDAATGLAARVMGTVVDITERKLAELELARVAGQFRGIADASPSILWTAAPDGTFLWASDAWYRFVGRDTANVFAGWQDYLHPEDRPRISAAWMQAVGTGSDYQAEARFRRADGAHRWFLVRARPSRDGEGRIVAWFGATTEIDDNKRTETALRDSEARLAERLAELESLYAEAPVGLALLDRSLRFVRINEALAEMNGFPVEQHVGRTPWEFVPELREDAEPAFLRVLESGEPLADVPVTGITPARPGIVREWREHFYPVRNAAGVVTGIGVIAEEVTEQRRMEMRLRDSEERFRGVFEHASIGIAITDLTGRFLSVNPAYCAMLGYGNDELLTMNFAQLVHPGDRDINVAMNRQLAAGEMPAFGLTNRYLRHDGTVIWVDKHVSLLRDAQNTATSIIVLVTDVTERRRSEEQVHLLMREVNHRAKNMLALVQAIARLTAASDPHEFVARFEERIQALAAGQELLVRGAWKGVRLDELVKAQLAHFAGLVGDRIRFRGPQLTIGAPAAQAIGMALHELATNAGKYGALSNDAGTIDIDWQVAGVGEEARFRIDWVERGGPVVEKPARRGFGTTAIVAMARSSLGAEVALGMPPEGLEWRLECPLDRVVEQGLDRPARDAPGTTPPPAGAGPILVVEDEGLVAIELASTLESAGFGVLGPVGSVRQAMQLLDRAGCAAAVLDVNLGAETAEPVAVRLKASGIPFVVVSGYSSEQQPIAFRDAPLVPKPFRADRLIGALRAMLAGGGAPLHQ